MSLVRPSFGRTDLLSAYFNVGRKTALTLAFSAIVAIAVADWVVVPNLALGLLYLFPVFLAAGFLSRWQILALCALCAVLRESFAPFHWSEDAVPRLGTVLFVYLGAGLFVKELARNRQLVVEHLRSIQEQVKLRKEAEEQLRVLIESSPAAILTADSGGKVLLANEAAHRLLGFQGEPLAGQPLEQFLPILADVIRSGATHAYRTTVQSAARRRNGEIFFAYTWFSTYQTESGPRLAAIIVDASEDLRDREELGLHQVLTSTRILVGAVAHEIRNLCGAISVVHTNLARVPGLAANEDFRALSTLVEGLSKLSSSELRPSGEEAIAPVDLHAVFDELRVVAEPSFEESEAVLKWDVPANLPLVWADRRGLLQVFVNLAQNSRRALEEAEQRELTVAASRHDDHVVVQFRDTGPGVAAPERLFQPFQPGADAAGLGLYVSRAIVRSFHGDLHYQPQPAGCCFAVELEIAGTDGAHG